MGAMKHDSKADAIRNYSFLKIFADHDSLNAAEWAFIQRLALADQEVDEQERSVLAAIFERAEKQGITGGVQAEINAFKKRYGIG